MRRFAVLLVVLSLAMKLAMPSGWMPGDKAFQLTLCTGIETVWMDGNGNLHDRKPQDSDEQEQKPCAFSGTLAFAGSANSAPGFERVYHVATKREPATAGAMGRGLAAPPPPQTGPPFLI